MKNKKQKLQHGDLVKVKLDRWSGLPGLIKYGMVIAQEEHAVKIVLSNGKTIYERPIHIEKITRDTNAL